MPLSFTKFDIQAALNGHSVIQRNGMNAVVRGQLNGKLLVDISVLEVSERDGCEVEIFIPIEVDCHGYFLASHLNHHHDLFMVSE